MLTRRQWLQRSAIMSLSPWVPTFLHRTARAAGRRPDRGPAPGGDSARRRQRRAQHGHSYRDEQYARLRPTLRLDTKDVIKFNDTAVCTQP